MAAGPSFQFSGDSYLFLIHSPYSEDKEGNQRFHWSGKTGASTGFVFICASHDM